ncbi:MAG: nucleotidyltransferase domain-containing protein [Chloroflexi bacterium]|nr:nucleotidyltransferase domain-containing protein [Chloroflexota bacterium]MBI3734249.1 nucleotidyltransferase domain-containing protein [Chloroflexota bacterium]
MSQAPTVGPAAPDLSLWQDAIVARILSIAQPERIILFGSRARGDARSDSDLDLLVIMPSQEPRHQRSAPFYRVLASLPIEVEVVVYTPDEVAEWQMVRGAFVTTALREGYVLYERPGRPDTRLAA